MFKTLFSFNSSTHELCEIKRTDLPKEAPVGDVYHWLLWEKDNNDLIRLEFVSMDKNDSVELREFSQGKLEFDHQQASLDLFDGENLRFESGSEISSQLQQAIQSNF